ncbi:MAG: uroporphyrinogen decarboxylase family protein [Acidimicrobiales bacterium]
MPIDLGGCHQTGMHVDSLYKLRQALHLDPPGTPVRVEDPFQMLGEIAADLIDAVGGDVVPLRKNAGTIFGYRNEGWKPWTTFGGTPVLVPAGFNIEPEANGDILAYPGGDSSLPPCARMPRGGLYFDALRRQDPIDEDHLDVEDNLQQYGPISEADLAYLQTEVEKISSSGMGVLGAFGGTGFGDVGRLPGMDLAHPKGIRAVDEWYMSLTQRCDYVYELFDRQCMIALANLAKVYAVVGERVNAVSVTSTDFGAQQGPFISPKTYRTLFKPFHAKVNDWIHANTGWKTFMHSCGSIWRLMDDILDAGFDCLNPVQTSAADMSPDALKERYGKRITFWGGGVDTQSVLPFGSPEEVRSMVRQRMRTFGAGGGFIFSAIHNIQAGIPGENLVALFEAAKDYRQTTQ